MDNAAAKVLVDIAKVQDDEVGDGTTSVAVLCGELLREAEDLISARIHPQTIIEGWRRSANISRQKLEELAVDNSQDDAAFREDLLNIAKTTLSSKLVVRPLFPSFSAPFSFQHAPPPAVVVGPLPPSAMKRVLGTWTTYTPTPA